MVVGYRNKLKLSVKISKKPKHKLATISNDNTPGESPTIETVIESEGIPYKDEENLSQEMPK